MVDTKPLLTVSVPAVLMDVSIDHILKSLKWRMIRTIMQQMSTRPLPRLGDCASVPELMSQQSSAVGPLVST